MGTKRITFRNGEIRVGGRLFCAPWIPSRGGYVRDISRGSGTLAPQISENLSDYGNMMEAREYVGPDGNTVSATDSMNAQIRKALKRSRVRERILAWAGE